VRLVVDASAWAGVVTPEAISVAARAALHDADLVAPDLLLAETASLLRKEVRRGNIAAADAVLALAATRRAIGLLVPMPALAEAALDLALRRDHPAYDCFYVALAQREAAPLVTADARLAARFAGDAEIRLLQSSPSA
jgi:predicted nucleic acid-binding protein